MRELRFSRRAKKYHNTEIQNNPPPPKSLFVVLLGGFVCLEVDRTILFECGVRNTVLRGKVRMSLLFL